ncbi:MAG: hypothetical protein HGB08_00630 [Candidatus Moranbacteria bacterium]|nr:hypothetical protein [Candidatus Moranbacteria bacterium]
MELIRKFESLGKGDASIAGGKGASLGEMTSAGIPVPPGFVVLSEAFEYFLAESDLNQEIEAILGRVDRDNIATVEQAAESIQALILAASMPESIAKEVEINFSELDSRYVAVRSSATAEDGAEHAWAGQLDSYLNTDKKNLHRNIQRCWASLFTPRAIFYRFEKDLNDTKISVAVVVQKMVESEVSGIAFSVHPITEDRNQLIIEAGYGLGESIVSGQITPDSYVVEKEPRKIVDRNIAEQVRGIFRKADLPAGGGNEWREIPDEKRNLQKLSDEQVLDLSEIILRIENHYGFPCDIEWAFEEGKFYVVQSRPITTLSNKKIEITEREPLEDVSQWVFWGRWKFPLFANATYNSYKNSPVYKKINMPEDFTGNATNIDGYVYGFKKDHAVFNEFIRNKFQSDHAWFENFFSLCEETVGYANRIKKDKDIALSMETFINIGCLTMVIHFCDKGLEMMVPEVAEASHLSSEEFSKLLVPHRPTYVMQYKQALRELKKENIKEFLDKFDWIGTNYLNGERLIEMDVEREMQDLPEIEQEPIIDESGLDEKAKSQINILQSLIYYRSINAELVNKVINSQWGSLDDLANKYGYIRNDFNVATPQEVITLLREGILPQDFQKRLDDGGLERNGIAYSDGKLYLLFGKELQEKLEIFEPVSSDSSSDITGTPAFKGKARGIVKIVENAGDLKKIEEGNIIVSPETMPDYIIGMKKAAAFVTNQGGITSHAAIVARELKKPCIIGTKIATQILKDGDLVEVDADNGVVRILERVENNNEGTDSQKIEFKKSYSRDTTLFMQGLWAKGLIYLAKDKFGWDNPHLPFVAHYVNEGVVEIWEHRKAIDWFLDRLLEQNKAKPEFLSDLLIEYKGLLAKLKDLHVKKFLVDQEELQSYSELIYCAAFDMTIFFYTGMDERNPETAKNIAVEARKEGDFFADNDVFVRKNISKIGGFSEELAGVVLPEEFENIPSEEVLVERLKSFLIIDGDNPYLGTLYDFSSSNSQYIFEGNEAMLQTDEIKGQTAYAGAVRGAVRIIKKQSQIQNMKQGDILVSPMTTPDFLPAMKMAAAFVTDEGGITCHAAIVARELKKPCIIGTKNATQILKDGDLVEVDADKGVVRILKKKP